MIPKARLAWYAQYEPPDRDGKPDRNQYAAQIMAHHWPGVPNHGDITAIDSYRLWFGDCGWSLGACRVTTRELAAHALPPADPLAATVDQPPNT